MSVLAQIKEQILKYNNVLDRSKIGQGQIEAMLLIGKTGVGKSTLAAAISKAELEVGDTNSNQPQENSDDDAEDSKTLVIKHKREDGYPRIASNTQVGTEKPEIVELTRIQRFSILVDMPGLCDVNKVKEV